MWTRCSVYAAQVWDMAAHPDTLLVYAASRRIRDRASPQTHAMRVGAFPPVRRRPAQLARIWSLEAKWVACPGRRLCHWAFVVA